MLLAISIALALMFAAMVFMAAWLVDLRWRSLQQDAELRSLRSSVDRVGQDVVNIYQREQEQVLVGAARVLTSGERMDPDAAALLVRSLAGGDRGTRDVSPGMAVISGAQEELTLVAEMLLAINPKIPEMWPEPPSIGNVLMALADRILAGLAMLGREGGGGPPPEAGAGEDEEEGPPSSEPGGGLPH